MISFDFIWFQSVSVGFINSWHLCLFIFYRVLGCWNFGIHIHIDVLIFIKDAKPFLFKNFTTRVPTISHFLVVLFPVCLLVVSPVAVEVPVAKFGTLTRTWTPPLCLRRLLICTSLHIYIICVCVHHALDACIGFSESFTVFLMFALFFWSLSSCSWSLHCFFRVFHLALDVGIAFSEYFHFFIVLDHTQCTVRFNHSWSV